jgi:MFS transporter, AAHS family, 3-hydroxyphenylpropionic acid transporter
MTTATASAARTTIALCLMAALCEGIDLQAAGVAAAGIAPLYKPAPSVMADFFAASTFGLLIGALLGGRLADRLGRRIVLIYSIAAFGLFSLLTAFAWDMQSLTWARFLTGLGLGGAFPMVMTMVSEASVAGRRTANTAIAYAGLPTGGVVISTIALLTGPANWRWIFIIGGVVPLVVTALMAMKLKESAEYRALQVSNQGSVTAHSQAGSFLQIMAQGRALRTILLWVSFFLALIIVYLLLNWLPTLLADNGLSKGQAAAVQILYNLGGTIAALTMGRLLVSRWRMPSLLAALAGVPIMFYVLSTIGGDFATAAVVVFVLSLAIFAIQAFLYASAPPSYPTWIRGVGVGAVIAVGRIGSIVGPKLGGWLKGLGHNSSQLLIDLLPVAIFGSLFALALLLNKPKDHA